MTTALRRNVGRVAGLCAVFVLTAAALTSCATAAREASTTAPQANPTTVTPGPIPAEDLRQAILSAIDSLGPARVYTEISSDFPARMHPESTEGGGFDPGHASVDLLVDRTQHLAFETRRMGRGDTLIQSSVVGRTVRMMRTEGSESEGRSFAYASETVLRDPASGLIFPDQLFFAASPRTLDVSAAVSATRLSDGTAELVLRVPRDPIHNAMIGMFTLLEGVDATLTVGPDNLPRELVVTTDWVDSGGEADQITQRATYRVEPVEAVRDVDVRLDIPAGTDVERMVELPLDIPKPDFPWPAYWLGEQFGGSNLIDANQQTGGSEGPNPIDQQVKLVYGPPGSSWHGDAIGPAAVTVREVPLRPSVSFHWGDSIEDEPPQRRTVAGRMATVKMVDATTSPPYEGGVDVLVEFPDMGVLVSSGRSDVSAEQILAALRPL